MPYSHIPLERIFHSSALTLFGSPFARNRNSRPLEYEFFATFVLSNFSHASLSILLSPFLLSFRSRLSYLSRSSLFRSKTETFLTFHTCFMGISRLRRKICKLNGINEKAEVPFFMFLSALRVRWSHDGRRCAVHYLNYLNLLNILCKIIENIFLEIFSTPREN